MFKNIISRDQFSSTIQTAFKQIEALVGRTLGPGGLPILIGRVGQTPSGEPLGPMITKDGVTVASETYVKDSEADLVMQAVKTICQKTNQRAGDGTTTAVVLGYAIYEAAIRYCKRTNVNPQDLKKVLEQEAAQVLEALKAFAKPVNDVSTLKAVATISSNGDESIADVVSSAVSKVGLDGSLVVDQGSSLEHELIVVNGYQFERGAQAGDRFFNNSEGTKFEAEKCAVLFFDGKIQNPNLLSQALQVLAQNAQSFPPLLIVANEFSAQVIQYLLMIKVESGLQICAVRSPHQTKVTTAMLDDLAVYTGGVRLGNGNRSLDNLTPEDFGLIDKVVVDKYKTTFFDGAGTDEEVLGRIEQLKAQKETAESPYDANLISTRIALLSEGVAKILVGGATEMEVKEKYHRIEDAVNAVRAALQEGVVPGGGIALYQAIHQNSVSQNLQTDVLLEALEAPFRRICENLSIHHSIVEDVLKNLVGEPLYSFDALKGELEDFLNEEGGLVTEIVDPVLVTREALTNAVSIATLLMTCGGALVIPRD